MEAKPISIKDLLGKSFNIPYYQRGYRWEEKQVNDLLNDLQEFYYRSKQNHESAGFYCLQPLVVVKNKHLSNDDNNPIFDLIDGQQRLTTIYLLLQYIKKKDEDFKDGYTLQYERLDKDNLFEHRFLYEFTEETQRYLREYNDFIFLFKAYQTIKTWFETEGHVKWSIIQQVLLGDGGTSTDQNDVRFLWYEPDEEVRTKEEANVLKGSIEIFNRLNYGQTPLSSTDLIKAMLMITDIYGNDEQSLREEESFRYASEWDMMEKRLHNRLLWGMLASNEYKPASHMELIFDYVAHDLYDKRNDSTLKEEDKWLVDAFKNIKSEDSDFSYRVISAYLLYYTNGNITSTEYNKRVKKVWELVQKIYHMFCNWYNNRKTYHLIGLYLLLHEKQMDGDQTPRQELLRNLAKKYHSESRTKFIEWLKQEIGDIVEIKKTYQDKNTSEKVAYRLDTINYNDTPKDIIRVLTLFNVDQTMRETAENPLFDFALFKASNPTSLEHIHPQHLKLGDNEVKEWYECRKESLRIEGKLVNSAANKNLRNAVKNLDKTLQQSNLSDQQKKDCERWLQIVDSYFDELADIDEHEMHTIKNMALVDGLVNTAFYNNLLDVKREIMYQKGAERDENDNPIHYIMIGTRKVFNKAFSPKETIDNMKYWGRKDRDAYYKKIEEIYKLYVK